MTEKEKQEKLIDEKLKEQKVVIDKATKKMQITD